MPTLNDDTLNLARIEGAIHEAVEKLARLQQDEEKLKATINPSASASITQIANLARYKITLLESLLALYAQAQNNAANTRVNLANQITLENVATQNYENATKALSALKTEKVSYQRQAEINAYYAKEYQARSGIMKILVLTCVPLLILLILKRYGILPDYVVNILSFTVFLIGLILFMWKAYDLSRRSNMNYDQYEFEMMPDDSSASRTETVYEYDKQQWDDLPSAYTVLQDVHSELDKGGGHIYSAATKDITDWRVSTST